MEGPVVYVALVHHPVVNRHGEDIVSAVTNLDIHDIARAARAFGVAGYFIVTPLPEQQHLVRKLVEHWTEGVGGELNQDRQEALQVVRIVSDLGTMRSIITGESGHDPLMCATSAREWPNAVSWGMFRRELEQMGNRSAVLLFGTASGLHARVIEAAHRVLAPIDGGGRYRHLSVRSAVAIALDRLLGRR